MGKTPGLYVPLDVNYPRDPAIRKAGEKAEVLYIRGMAYAKASKTDGFIPEYDLEVVGAGLVGLRPRVAALVKHGLWLAGEDGWEIRSWMKWNSSNDELDGIKQAKRDAAIRTNHERWHAERLDPTCPHCSEQIRRDFEAVAPPIALAIAPPIDAAIAPVSLREEEEKRTRRGRGR